MELCLQQLLSVTFRSTDDLAKKKLIKKIGKMIFLNFSHFFWEENRNFLEIAENFEKLFKLTKEMKFIQKIFR